VVIKRTLKRVQHREGETKVEENGGLFGEGPSAYPKPSQRRTNTKRSITRSPDYKTSLHGWYLRREILSSKRIRGGDEIA